MDKAIQNVWGPPTEFIRWVVVNGLLAVLPVGLASLAGVLRARCALGWKLADWLLWPVLLLWLLFVPNSCYLITDLRHVLWAIDVDNLWVNVHADPQARSGLVFWAAVAAFDVLVGSAAYVLAIRLVQALAERASPRLLLLKPLFFLLVGLGVYLGIVARCNSWDLLTRPVEVIRAALETEDQAARALHVALLGGALWVLFEVLDVWVDGLAVRWSRWRRPAGAEMPPRSGDPPAAEAVPARR
jgi:uncharacterized membrane protein